MIEQQPTRMALVGHALVKELAHLLLDDTQQAIPELGSLSTHGCSLIDERRDGLDLLLLCNVLAIGLAEFAQYFVRRSTATATVISQWRVDESVSVSKRVSE